MQVQVAKVPVHHLGHDGGGGPQPGGHDALVGALPTEPHPELAPEDRLPGPAGGVG